MSYKIQTKGRTAYFQLSYDNFRYSNSRSIFLLLIHGIHCISIVLSMAVSMASSKRQKYGKAEMWNRLCTYICISSDFIADYDKLVLKSILE